jgi:FixJ family two-component response regulator
MAFTATQDRSIALCQRNEGQKPSRGRARDQAPPAGTDLKRPHVLIVDDDEGMRLALCELLMSVGIDATCFASTRELMEARLPRRPGCLILDVRLPGSSGIDFQSHLAATGDAPPIIFLTGYGDIPMSVQAMKAGAVDFLTKPVRDQVLLDAVMIGIGRDIAQQAAKEIASGHVDRYATLTPRERQVLQEVARGRVNKQIAYDLGISYITVKLHRSNAMRKMQVTSVGALILAWESLPQHLRELQPLQKSRPLSPMSASQMSSKSWGGEQQFA